MNLKAIASVGLALALLGSIGTGRSSAAQAESSPGPHPVLRHAQVSSDLPLAFEPNVGQASATVRYIARGHGYNLALNPTGATLTLGHPRPPSGQQSAVPASPSTIQLTLVGGNPTSRIDAESRLPGMASYFLGRDRSAWHTHIPTYAQVRYSRVYPGVDLVYHGVGRQLAYGFQLAPGADPQQIRLAFGGDLLSLDASGDLVVHTGDGTVLLHAPSACQEVGGTRRSVTGSYILLDSHTAGIRVGSHDAHDGLTINTTVTYSTYYGGSGDDQGEGVAVDGAGNVYMVGTTSSPGAPKQAFVTKFDPTGSTVLYSAIIGSACDSAGHGIAVDSAGDAYLTGLYTTQSGSFCTQRNILVAKIDPAGQSLLYTTVVPGTSDTWGNAIAVDQAGNAYVTGQTAGGLPTTPGAFQPTPGIWKAPDGLPGDAFVLKVDGNGAIVYCTYLGGSRPDMGGGIAVDGAGDVYVTGQTQSADFPTTATAVQPTGTSGTLLYGAAFVTVLSPDGSSLLYSTYLGGWRGASGQDIKVDATGSAYVVGATSSSDFPSTSNAFSQQCGTDGQCNPVQPCVGCDWVYGDDVFVAKIDPTQAGVASLVYSTFLGGSYIDHGNGLAIGRNGLVYVTGYTGSTDFPTTATAFQSTNHGGAADAFLAELDPTQPGTASLVYSTYLGGSGDDRAFGIAVDPNGTAWMTGTTNSSDFPIQNGVQGANAGGYDAFLTRLSS